MLLMIKFILVNDFSWGQEGTEQCKITIVCYRVNTAIVSV